MAEQAGWTLVELPALVLWPQMRELLASEARSRARGGIVPGHPIAADRPHELACLKRREAPPRLASDEQRRQSGGMAKQASEVTLAEMMEKEIGDNHVELVSFFEKLEDVHHAWPSPPAECGKALARFKWTANWLAATSSAKVNKTLNVLMLSQSLVQNFKKSDGSHF